MASHRLVRFAAIAIFFALLASNDCVVAQPKTNVPDAQSAFDTVQTKDHSVYRGFYLMTEPNVADAIGQGESEEAIRHGDGVMLLCAMYSQAGSGKYCSKATRRVWLQSLDNIAGTSLAGRLPLR